MDTVLDNLFMSEAMTGMVVRFAEQAGDLNFLAPYEAGSPLTTDVDTFAWDEQTYSRGMAPVAGPNAPTKARRALGYTTRTGRVFSIKEHVDLDVRFLAQARGVGSAVPNPGKTINDNLKNLTMRVLRTLNYWAAQSFTASGGAVDLGAFPNADIPSGGPGQMTYPIQSISVTEGAWSSAGTKIRSGNAGTGGINSHKRVYQRTSGLRWVEAIASDVVEGYMMGNTELQSLAHDQPVSARILETSYQENGNFRFAGVNWNFARDFYVTEANEASGAVTTTTDIISDTDIVAMLPDRSLWSECFLKVEGLNCLPAGPISQVIAASAAGGNGAAALSSMVTYTRGWGAWVTLSMNPMRLTLHVQWTGCLVHKVKNAAGRLNTTP